MKNILFCVFILAILSCKHEEDYINPLEYNIKVGDSCKIYFATNSCCADSMEISNAHHIQLTNTLLVESEPKGCEGCNTEYAYVFKGLRAGSDTVKLYSMAMGDFSDSTWKMNIPLTSNGYSLDGSYIIHVSK